MRYLIQHWLGLSVKFGQSFSFVLACVITQLAVAQEIEEVTVQAVIQEDAALDDLVSVSSLSAEKLADAGIENVEDVAAYVPNLVLTQTETGTSIVIRGIGAGVNQGFDQSVGLYIDGVPLPRANMARAPFLDLSSVQVLRGPQYVLDGNYSIAGSVHMLSDLSVDEFKSAVDFNYVPSQNAQSLLITAGGPLSDTFAARVAIQAKRSDGYIENVTRNEGNESDDLVARLVVGFFPTDNLSFKFKFEKGSFKTVGRAVEIILDQPVHKLEGFTIPFDVNQDGVINTVDGLNGSPSTRLAYAGPITTAFYGPQDFILEAHKTRFNTPAFLGTAGYLFSEKSYLQRLAEIYTNPAKDTSFPDGSASQPTPVPAPVPLGLLDDELNFKRGADAEEYSINNSENFTLNIEYWLGEHNIKSASSYITYTFEEQFDADFTAAPLIVGFQEEGYEQLFQRFDYTSPEGYFLEVKAGAFYMHSNLSFHDRNKLQLSEKPSHAQISGNRNHVADFSFDPNEPFRQYFGAAGVKSPMLLFESFGTDRIFEQSADTVSAYFQSTLNWSDTFRTRLGVRYTHSVKKAVRDLAIVGDNGEIPTVKTGSRVITERAIQNMFSAYLGFFGTQLHTDRYELTQIDDGIITNGTRAVRGRRREEQLLPSLTIEWDASDDVSIFASARMANKLGGYDARSNTSPSVPAGTGAPPGTFEFKDEDALTYEIGTKWFLPYGLGEMTAVAFYTDFTNLQVSRFDGKVGFNVDNAGAANSKGIEIEGLMQFTDQFSMNYSLAWIDFTFEDFVFGSCHLGERPDHFIFLSLSRIPIFVSTGGRAEFGEIYPIRYEGTNRQPSESSLPGTIRFPWQGRAEFPDFVDDFDSTVVGSPGFCDFKGKTNQFVAEWQGTFSFNYETEIKGLGLFKPTLDVLYNSGYFASVSQDPLAAQDEYIQLNGRLALVSFEDTWTLALTGENLTNQKIVSYANDTPLGARFQGARGFIGFIRPPRTIGLNLRYNFY